MTSKEILADLVRKNPQFFEEYESMAQMFYKVLDSVTSIPEAHAKAMIALLENSGYEIRKKPDLNVVGDNVIQLTPKK